VADAGDSLFEVVDDVHETAAKPVRHDPTMNLLIMTILLERASGRRSSGIVRRRSERTLSAG
jgi:hypothetical protein